MSVNIYISIVAQKDYTISIKEYTILEEDIEYFIDLKQKIENALAIYKTDGVSGIQRSMMELFKE